MSKKQINKQGFTLAELLIVVAIIAVLVAISIPIFSSQLEKSRESTDLANVRSAYAEVMSAAITDDKNVDFDKDGNSNYSDTDGWFYPVSLKQKKEGWSSSTPITVGGVTSGTDGGDNADGTWKGYPKADGTCTVYCSNDGVVKFVWDGESSGGAGAPPTVANDQINAFREAVINEYGSGFKFLSGSWDSTYSGNVNGLDSRVSKVWKYLKDNAGTTGFDADHIKTWTIINPYTGEDYSFKTSKNYLKNDQSNLYYVWSTKDVSECNVGNYIPVMMSNTDSSGKTTYTVGNVKVTNGDSGKPYNVISNGENTVRPNKSGYNIDNLINSGDNKKKSFDNYEDATRYYDTLANAS